jgi:transcription-repair coupling factor (superfamily II helicase)
MNLELLLKEYAKDPRCFQIADRITLSKMQQIHLSGLRGSATEFVLSSVFNHSATSQLNHLIILRDAEEAAYFHNTFENLTQALDIFYFPSSFKNKKNYRLLNSSHVMLRTEALTKIASGTNKKVLITYPEALFEKVVLPNTLIQNIISIKQSESLDVNSILSKFVD